MHFDSLDAIFFDLDDTLLDHRGAVRRGLHDVYGLYPAFFGSLDFAQVHAAWHAINEAIWEEYSRGLLTAGELRLQRARQLVDWVRSMLGTAAGTTPEEIRDSYMRCYEDHCTLYDGVLPMLDALKDRYTLGIITNGFASVQGRKIGGTGLGGRIGHVIVSEEVGVHKPDAEIFRIALASAHVEAAGSVYVGDNYLWDVRGAAGAGMATVWYNAIGTHRPAEYADVDPLAEVRSIGDLASLFGITLERSPQS
ncbi:MAG TPA: HAD-IA family hydrolase [Candidatus Kapabacteria bacterium]|nr:HAD-IA family hydrolase [Candidatus Kapabacteria bacterium]